MDYRLTYGLIWALVLVTSTRCAYIDEQDMRGESFFSSNFFSHFFSRLILFVFRCFACFIIFLLSLCVDLFPRSAIEISFLYNGFNVQGIVSIKIVAQQVCQAHRVEWRQRRRQRWRRQTDIDRYLAFFSSKIGCDLINFA